MSATLFLPISTNLRHDNNMARPIALFILITLIQANEAHARTPLGTFERWGAFRDETPARCFAIAEPLRGGNDSRAFASVATWPLQRVRGQIHIRLSRAKAPDAPVVLTIGTKRFSLASGNQDAWAQDSRADAAITAAMRSATSMTISSRATNGQSFNETYALKGAATAMDAAALGCARR